MKTGDSGERTVDATRWSDVADHLAETRGWTRTEAILLIMSGMLEMLLLETVQMHQCIHQGTEESLREWREHRDGGEDWK